MTRPPGIGIGLGCRRSPWWCRIIDGFGIRPNGRAVSRTSFRRLRARIGGRRISTHRDIVRRGGRLVHFRRRCHCRMLSDRSPGRAVPADARQPAQPPGRSQSDSLAAALRAARSEALASAAVRVSPSPVLLSSDMGLRSVAPQGGCFESYKRKAASRHVIRHQSRGGSVANNESSSGRTATITFLAPARCRGSATSFESALCERPRKASVRPADAASSIANSALRAGIMEHDGRLVGTQQIG